MAQSFVINGHITGSQQPYIYLSYEGHKDSSKIKKGAFHLEGNISQPCKASLHFTPHPVAEETRPFILDRGHLEITVKGKDLQGAVIKGSVAEDEAEELNDIITQVQNNMALLSAKYDKAEDAWEKAVSANLSEQVQDSLAAIVSAIHDQLNNRIPQIKLHFIATHPDSYISALQLRSFVQVLPLDTLQQLYNGLTPRIRESDPGKEIANEIRMITAASPGNEAPDFKAVDINNKPLQLSSFRGNVVLLDFWASWCVPCREGNPHLITLFNKYKSKGFTIIGIADDDQQQAAWHKAVEKDKIGIWHHVLRGKGKKADLGHKYTIYSLPTKILVDKNGVILGRYGFTDEAALEKKLAEIL